MDKKMHSASECISSLVAAERRDFIKVYSKVLPSILARSPAVASDGAAADKHRIKPKSSAVF